MFQHPFMITFSLPERSQITIPASEADPVQVLADRDSVFAGCGEQVSNLAHRKSFTARQFMSELRPHVGFNLLM
jgi:hypothetical protein